MDLVEKLLGAEDEHDAEADDHDLGRDVEQRQAHVEARGAPQAANVDRRQQGDHHDPGDHVFRAGAQSADEGAEIVGDEEGADRDRDHVVEHQRPAGHEGDDLVEGVAGEGG